MNNNTVLIKADRLILKPWCIEDTKYMDRNFKLRIYI